jgi:hypothetical protein
MDFINRVKPFNTKQLLKYQKYVIVSAIVIALVLPFTYDPITQFVVAIPIIALYYLSVIIITINNRPRKAEKVRQKYNSFPSIANVQSNYSPIIAKPTSQKIIVSIIEESHEVPSVKQQILNNKYFDVAPIGSINQDVLNRKLRTEHSSIKQVPKTKFIDGFRPLITT